MFEVRSFNGSFLEISPVLLISDFLLYAILSLKPQTLNSVNFSLTTYDLQYTTTGYSLQCSEVQGANLETLIRTTVHAWFRDSRLMPPTFDDILEVVCYLDFCCEVPRSYDVKTPNPNGLMQYYLTTNYRMEY